MPAHAPIPAAPTAPDVAQTLVVRAFVDFWNFHLTMERWCPRFRLDWARLGHALTQQVEAVRTASGRPGRLRYGGLHLYLSHNANEPRDDGLRRWAQNYLARIENMHVVLKARRPKAPPDCPHCHVRVTTCPACGEGMQRTGEKGIDAAIVTDMVCLAWEKRCDIAVLVAGDEDFVPAVERLQQNGHAVVHASFGSNRGLLAQACCASLDLRASLASFERSATTRARRALATETASRKGASDEFVDRASSAAAARPLHL
jgi:uncharacterized LabA/DUF88 family protein